jgi:hypothetical protein
MSAQELIDAASTLVAGDRGLLAMDESNPTCNMDAHGGVHCWVTPLLRQRSNSSLPTPTAG